MRKSGGSIQIISVPFYYWITGPISKITECFYPIDNSLRNYKNHYTEDGLESLLIDYQTGRSSYLPQKEQQKLVLWSQEQKKKSCQIIEIKQR